MKHGWEEVPEGFTKGWNTGAPASQAVKGTGERMFCSRKGSAIAAEDGN